VPEKVGWRPVAAGWGAGCGRPAAWDIAVRRMLRTSSWAEEGGLSGFWMERPLRSKLGVGCGEERGRVRFFSSGKEVLSSFVVVVVFIVVEIAQ